MNGEAGMRLRRLAVFCAAVMVLGWLSEGRSASFASGNMDFTGRGRACGLLAGDRGADNMPANPSLLGLSVSQESSVFAAFMAYIGGLKGGAVGYAAEGGERWGYGAYLTYLASGSVPIATWDDPVGGSGADFSYSEVAGGLACGVEVAPYLLLGGSVKVIREALDDQAATAACCDLGATAVIEGSEQGVLNAAYACVVSRGLVRGAWNTDSGRPPSSLEIGLAFDLLGGRASAGGWFAAADRGRRQALVGLSGLLSQEFEARVGYKRNVGTYSDASYDLPAARGLVAGFSVLLGKFWIDYTYEDASPLDGIHRVGMRTAAPGAVRAAAGAAR